VKREEIEDTLRVATKFCFNDSTVTDNKKIARSRNYEWRDEMVTLSLVAVFEGPADGVFQMGCSLVCLPRGTAFGKKERKEKDSHHKPDRVPKPACPVKKQFPITTTLCSSC
jgi:hypothetical protein